MNSDPGHSPQVRNPVPRGLYIFASILLPAAILCTFSPPTIYGPNIDDSLHWAFNYIADGRFALATHTTFPHGSLAFLLYPVLMGNNYHVAYLLYVVLCALMAVSLLRLSVLIRPGNFAGAVLAVLLIIIFADLQIIITGLVIALVFFHHRTGRLKYVFVFSALSVFNLFIKPYGGIICGMIIGIHALASSFKEKNAKTLVVVCITYALFYLVGWVSIFRTFTGSVDFLVAQVQLSLHNSEAVQYVNEDHLLLPLLSIAFTVSLFFSVREKTPRHFLLLMALPFFAAWKHAMARSDIWHMEGFLEFTAFIACLLFLLREKRNAGPTIISLLGVGCFMFYLSRETDYFQRRDFSPFRPSVLYSVLFEPQDLKKRTDEENRYVCRNETLPDSVRNIIGNETVDIYPWNYALVAMNNLNWTPRPVINSYAAYTPWLDNKDAEHFDSGRAPRFIIWHFTDPNGRGWSLESIDNRHLLNDEPLALCRLLANYEPVLKNARIILYKRRREPLEIRPKKISDERKVKWNQWIDVPPAADHTIGRARIKWEKGFAGSLKSALYKGEICYIFYELEDGHIISNRLVPGNAGRGVWLNPLPLQPGFSVNGETVKKIKIQCLYPAMMKEDLSIRFETVEFRDRERVLSPSELFMGQSGRDKKTLLHLMNKTERITQPALYIAHRSAQVTKRNSMSPPFSYKVDRGGSGGSLVIPLDSILKISNTETFRFQFEGVVKCDRDTKARFIVTDHPAGGAQAIWEKAVIEVTNKSEAWTYVSFFLDLNRTELPSKDRLYFSLSNQDGTEAVLLDDWAVTITEKAP